MYTKVKVHFIKRKIDLKRHTKSCPDSVFICVVTGEGWELNFWLRGSLVISTFQEIHFKYSKILTQNDKVLQS